MKLELRTGAIVLLVSVSNANQEPLEHLANYVNRVITAMLYKELANVSFNINRSNSVS
jgi:hypothetical protein